jgi:hypothetical protein
VAMDCVLGSGDEEGSGDELCFEITWLNKSMV